MPRLLLFLMPYKFKNSKVTLKRSPSTVSSKVPFISFMRLSAIDSPSPLPSVFRELSPLTKRSFSSSLEILKRCSRHILEVMMAPLSFGMMSMYTLVPGWAYLFNVVHQIIKHSPQMSSVCLNHDRRNVIF